VEIFDSKIFRFNCEEEMLNLEANGTLWKQYVHRCRVYVPPERASYVDAFKYTIYSQVADIEDKEQLQGLNED